MGTKGVRRGPGRLPQLSEVEAYDADPLRQLPYGTQPRIIHVMRHVITSVA